MQTSLTFQSIAFDVTDRNGQPWIQSRQLASALGYKDESSVRKIYERNADEFTDDMTATVKMTVGITPVDVRIFSPRGCYAVAMFARTPVAKAFRVWVLDVLETLNAAEKRELPTPDTPITPDQQCTLQNMVKALVDKGGHYAALWSRFNNHFRLGSYKQLPQSLMGDAVGYLMKMDVAPKQKALPEPATPDVDAILASHFQRIRALVREILEEERAIYAIVKQHRGNVLNTLDTRRAVFSNMHTAMDEQWYAVQHAVNAVEYHAKSMCVMSSL